MLQGDLFIPIPSEQKLCPILTRYFIALTSLGSCSSHTIKLESFPKLAAITVNL